MPRDVVYRILLFVNTTVGHSVERVHALAALYDEMTMQAAEHMVAIWQALQQARACRARRIGRCSGTTRAPRPRSDRNRGGAPARRPPQRRNDRRDRFLT